MRAVVKLAIAVLSFVVAACNNRWNLLAIVAAVAPTIVADCLLLLVYDLFGGPRPGLARDLLKLAIMVLSVGSVAVCMNPWNLPAVAAFVALTLAADCFLLWWSPIFDETEEG